MPDENLIAAQWMDADGLHIISPMNPMTPQQQQELTIIYQNNIRNSPIWDEFIKIYGPDGAENALKQCRVQTGGNLK